MKVSGIWRVYKFVGNDDGVSGCWINWGEHRDMVGGLPSLALWFIDHEDVISCFGTEAGLGLTVPLTLFETGLLIGAENVESGF